MLRSYTHSWGFLDAYIGPDGIESWVEYYSSDHATEANWPVLELEISTGGSVWHHYMQMGR